MATSNSGNQARVRHPAGARRAAAGAARSSGRHFGVPPPPGVGRWVLALGLALCLRVLAAPGRELSSPDSPALPGSPPASPPPAQVGVSAAGAPAVAALAYRRFVEARGRHESDTTDPRKGWEFLRAAFEWAEFATNDTQRAGIAESGITSGRGLVEAHPELAPAHYYLAKNLGQLASTKTVGALRIVAEMERRFHRARELDPTVDYAGPDRFLGMLYLKAPGWPASVGNRAKARVHLERAAQLSPDYPGNRLGLLEACVRWKEPAAVQTNLNALLESLPRARTQLVGDEYAVAWVDWEERLRALAKRPALTNLWVVVPPHAP